MEESHNINVFSLNVNGLGDSIKRQAVFQKLKKKGPGVFLLQETHSSEKSFTQWSQQWESKNIFFSHGTSNSKGVAILFSKNYQFEIKQELKDKEGRFLIIDVLINDRVYTIANLYAPTRNMKSEQLNVLKSFQESMQLFTLENSIIGGDFNLYLNPRLDKLDTMPDNNDNPEYRVNLLSFLETENLIDIWRTLNPYSPTFTWYRGTSRSRLDYFFTSEHLLNTIKSTDILPGFHSDHSLINICFSDNNKQNIGKGFWKFNSSLLHDTDYVNKIKTIIAESKNKYSEMTDKRIIWELIKMDIRNFTVPYCVKKKRDANELENMLNKKLIELYNSLETGDQSENIQMEYQSILNKS
jgi:exonuclease III